MRTDGAATHEIDDWVDIYASWGNLQKPEAAILEEVKGELPRMRMLDVGVGGGRTTVSFAPVAREYVGIDYDQKMIDACEKRFERRKDGLSFATCDARSMTMFEPNSFDFILFSFNGIDYLSHEDRLRTLSEIRRVGKPGQRFAFSSHNLNSIDRMIPSPRTVLSRLVGARANRSSRRFAWRYLILRLRNASARRLKDREHARIYDGVYSDKLSWLWQSFWKRLGYFYYIRPETQVKQLREAGYEVIGIYSAEGDSLSESQLASNQDFWLYYLCRIVKD